MGARQLDRFYWLYPDSLAGSSLPGRLMRRAPQIHGPGDGQSCHQLESDLRWLQRQGIEAVLTLTEDELPSQALQLLGIQALHVPIPDMSAPTDHQLRLALAFIDRQHSQGKAVVVHCLMGQGRTGTVLAAQLIRHGSTAESAIAELRRICPGAIESRAQRTALQKFADAKTWMV